MFNADYHLSEWSDGQLNDILSLLILPPEVLLRAFLPSDISINEARQVRLIWMQRAIVAIICEKQEVREMVDI